MLIYFLFDASFEAFTAAMFQVEIFWAMTPRCVVGYHRFRGPGCLHFHEAWTSETLASYLQQYAASQHIRPRVVKFSFWFGMTENRTNLIHRICYCTEIPHEDYHYDFLSGSFEVTGRTEKSCKLCDSGRFIAVLLLDT
jgi:hypothetical protein